MTVLADTGVLYGDHDTDAKRHEAAVFADAVTVFERYDDRKLSFTDATTVALTERHGIDRVLSFDDNFDCVVRRTDPAELSSTHCQYPVSTRLRRPEVVLWPLPTPTELPPEAVRRVSPPTRGSVARPLPNTVFEAEPQRVDTGPHVRSPGVFQNSIIPRKERLCEEFCP